MRIIDELLLNKFRGKGNCEFCWRFVKTDPHHIFCKGMGSGSRLDIRENLISLCRFCHSKVHSGEIRRDVLLNFVAIREGTTYQKVLDKILEMRNAKKGTARPSEADSRDRDSGK